MLPNRAIAQLKSRGALTLFPLTRTIAPMPRRLFAILLPALHFALSAFAADGPKDAVVLLIRHAEKPESGFVLSPRGQQRADAYPRYFHKFTVDSKPLRLDAIFASSDSEESHRPRLTVEPLARSAKLEVDTRFRAKQTAKLADELRATQRGKHVLVCWHHGDMPDLLQALGARPHRLLPDGEWPGSVFDWVIQLRFDSDGRLIPAATKRIAEHLLPGDSW